MKKLIVGSSLVALLGLSTISCTSECVVTNAVPLDTIRAITLCELRSDAGAKLDMHVVHVVTNSTEIASILKGITVGEQIPITKAIYRRVIRLERQGSNEVVSISYFEPYYEKAGMKHSALRIDAKEYKTSRHSIEVMNGLYDRYMTTSVLPQNTSSADNPSPCSTSTREP